MNIDDFIENIVGFTTRIDTPFGEICTLPCELYTNNRKHKQIEDSIDKILPYLNQKHQKATFNGNLLNSLVQYSHNYIF